jgi:RimJ/RimL family protein N-acetyltransferase
VTVTLEPLRVHHADEMVGVLADPALYAFTGGAPPSQGELQARYARQVGHRGWLNWIVRQQGVAVGTVQATVEGDVADLAWVIGTAHQGRGLATEAARAAMSWLRAEGVKTFRAYIHPDHAASAGVARKLGLQPTDVVHDGEIRWLGR